MKKHCLCAIIYKNEILPERALHPTKNGKIRAEARRADEVNGQHRRAPQARRGISVRGCTDGKNDEGASASVKAVFPRRQGTGTYRRDIFDIVSIFPWGQGSAALKTVRGDSHDIGRNIVKTMPPALGKLRHKR